MGDIVGSSCPRRLLMIPAKAETRVRGSAGRTLQQEQEFFNVKWILVPSVLRWRWQLIACLQHCHWQLGTAHRHIETVPRSSRLYTYTFERYVLRKPRPNTIHSNAIEHNHWGPRGVVGSQSKTTILNVIHRCNVY